LNNLILSGLSNLYWLLIAAPASLFQLKKLTVLAPRGHGFQNLNFQSLQKQSKPMGAVLNIGH